ncbi:MAG: hypothetical protein WCJ95_03060 [Mariniphaga sp.]
MKTYLLKIAFLVVFSLLLKTLLACDICGCSSGNYFLGPSPQFNKYFIGTRYSFRSFSTVLKSDNKQFSKDFYQTAELWGGIKIKQRFQVLVFLPYNVNHSKSDDGNRLNQGLGDLTLIGNYSILDKLSLTKESNAISQQLWLGFGVKLPTGLYAIDQSEVVSSANSQPGTGSIDYLVTTSYNLVIENWGIASNLNYKINQSAASFHFGNRFSATAFAFRTIPFKSNSISPTIGLLYENLQQSELAKLKIESTGGNALLVAAGLESKFKNTSIGINAQLPIDQNISDLQTKIKLRGMVHLTFAF